MDKVVFHIGVAKAGSTSLQENLFNKLEDCTNLGRPNHHNKAYVDFLYGITRAEDIDVNRYIEPFVELVKEKRSQRSPVIISDECLQNSTIYSYSIRRLKSCFPNSEIVVLLRNQLTAIQSYYAEAGYRLIQVPAADEFNRMKYISFDEFLEYSILAHETTYLHHLKYKRLLRVIEQHFTKEKIHVLLFEEMVNEPEVFMKHVAKILGADSVDLLALWKQEKPQNPRQSANYLSWQKLRTKIPVKSVRRYFPGLGYLLPKFETYLKRGKAHLSEFKKIQIEALRDIYQQENRYLQNEYNLDLLKWGYLLPDNAPLKA